LHVPLCAGIDGGAGDGAGARTGAGAGTGICCTMVIGAGVGLETDAMHRRRPVTPTMPERIWMRIPASVISRGMTAKIILSNVGFRVAPIMKPTRNRKNPT
jgi:hypothetical protein